MDGRYRPANRNSSHHFGMAVWIGSCPHPFTDLDLGNQRIDLIGSVCWSLWRYVTSSRRWVLRECGRLPRITGILFFDSLFALLLRHKCVVVQVKEDGVHHLSHWPVKQLDIGYFTMALVLEYYRQTDFTLEGNKNVNFSVHSWISEACCRPD